MDRKFSDRILTSAKTKEEAKTMGSVALSPDMASSYAKQMVELESRGNGDQMNALERVGRNVGMTARSLRRLINGETDPSVSLLVRIHKAYLDLCARKAESLMQKIEAEKARFGSEHFEDLSAELQALRAKIDARREGVKN
ncbi:hypothetical protein [Sinorhizobium glycinis]|nr:hypothetical protein [Sinorhizobium glycinis]